MAADGRIVIDVILDDGSVARGVADVSDRLGGIGQASEKSSLSIGKMVSALGLVAAAKKGIDMITSSISSAVARVDTLSGFPIVMERMGFSSDQARASIDKLSEGIQGLPTTLDGIVKSTQNIALMTGDLDGATNTALALNNAFLASGSSSADAERGLVQYVQMLSKGKVDMVSWQTLQETMGFALNKTAEAFGFTGKSAQRDLYSALQKGSITFDDFNAKIVELNGSVGGFGEIAKASSAGIATAFSNMNTAVVRGVANIIQAIQDVLAKTPLESIENILGSIGKAFSYVLGLIASGIQSFDPTPLVNAFEVIETSVAKAIDYIKSYVQKGLENVKGFWSENGSSIISTVKTNFDTVLTTIQGVLNIVVPFIQEQLSKMQQFWLENGSQILDAVTNAFNGIMAVIDFVMPAIKFLIEIIWTAIKQIITGALDVIMGAVKIFSGLFTGDFSKMWEGIKQLFSGAIDVIIGWMTLSFVGGLKSLLTNLAKTGLNLIKGMWDDIAKIFSSMGTKVSGFASEMATKVSSYFTNLLNNAKNIFGTLKTFGESTWNSLKQVVVRAAKQIWDDVVTNFTGLLNSVKTTMNTVKTTVSDIWGSVMTFFRNIDLSQIGKNIIQGLINGIGSMASAVWDKAKSIADGVKKTIQSALDIHSPSRWMRDFVAGNMAKGFVIGIDKNEGLIAKASEKLGDLVKPNIVNPLRGVRANIGNITSVPTIFHTNSNSQSSTSPVNVNQSVNMSEMQAVINIGGHEARGVVQFITNEQSTMKRRNNRQIKGGGQ